MSSNGIKCPGCGIEIEVAEVLRQQVTEQLKGEMQGKMSEAHKQLEDQAKQFEEEKSELERSLKAKVAEKEEALKKKLKAEATEKNAAELKDLQEALEAKDASVKEMQAKELEFRQKQRELEESKAALELDIVRKMDEERSKLLQQAEEQFNEKHSLKEKEKDRLINTLRESLEDAKRKADQGSVEAQGETLEDDIKEWLERNFPYDKIEEVKKGALGADVKQTVKDAHGREVGMILWESKNARSWSASWVQKLKDDQRAAGADIGMLVTAELPKDIKQFGSKDGIWVSSYPIPLGVVALMRESILRAAFERSAGEGKDEKMNMLYTYLTGPEFRQKVEAIVETFSAMKEQLETERRSMKRLWKVREAQIDRVLDSTVDMTGRMEGIIGNAMLPIPALELPEGEEAGDEVEETE
jgi:hypothetical protein